PMMPPYFPFHDFCIYASGVAEIGLGLALLNPVTRAGAAWALEVMLVVFLTVHIYMLQERGGKFASIPEWVLWARLPAQGALMAWAYLYT
ncbi:MAG: DoxX family protein, partial [Bdellovibrionota bacterium]